MKRYINTPNGAFLIFTLLNIMPFTLIIVYCFYLASYKHYYSRFLYNSALFLPSICVLFVVLILLILAFIISSKGFITKIKSWILNIIHPIIWGSFIGYVLSFFYLFAAASVDRTDYDSVISKFISIYFTSTGVFVAFYGIFGDRMLFMDIETVMLNLVKDLRICKKRFVWCYPGLSFGSITVRGQLYKDLKEELEKIIYKGKEIKKINRTFYIYPESEILELYIPYKTELIDLEKNDKRKKALEDGYNTAIEDSKELIENLEVEYAKLYGKNIGVLDREYSPPNFRFHIIIIDNIVYLLHALGLPYKFADGNYHFTDDIEGKDFTPVEFVAYRIVNNDLSNQLSRKIENEILKHKQFKIP